MAADDDIRVRIAGDLSDIRKALDQLRSQTRDSGKAAKAAQRDWTSFGRGLDTVKRHITGIVGAYLSFRGIQSLIRGIVRETSAQEKAQAQVAAAIHSTGAAAGLTADELGDMASRFQSVTTFADDAILNAQAQLLTFTKIGRENFERATAAVLDLSTRMDQDLRTSVVQVGKALNDPILGLTALARAGIQFTAAQKQTVRQLVETGRFVDAQRLILKELETQFGGSAQAARNTFGGALEALGNTAGDLLEAEGPSLTNLVSTVQELEELLQSPDVKSGIQTLVAGFAQLAKWAAEAATGLANFGTQLGALFAGLSGNLSEEDRLEDWIRGVDRALNGNWLTTPLALIGKTREELVELRKDLEALLAAGVDPSRGRIQRGGAVPPPAPGDGTSGDVIDPRQTLTALRSRLAAASIVLNDELKRLGAELDARLADNLVSYAEFYRQRAALETTAIEQELTARRNALALVTEEIRLLEARGETAEKQEEARAKLIAEITVLERQRGDVATKAARDQAAAERSLAEQLATVRTRLAEAQGDTAGARIAQLQTEFRDLLARLQAEGNTAGAELVRSLIDVETAKARLDELDAVVQRVLGDQARAESGLQAQVTAQVISEGEARRRIITLHTETAAKIRELIPLMRSLAEATGDPAAIDRLKDLQAELENLELTINQVGTTLAADFRDGFEEGFAGFIRGTKSAGEAFRGLVDTMLDSLAQLAAQQAFEGLFGGGGGLAGFFGKLFGQAHTGGIAGESTTLRRLPALAFAGAPRLHDGGLASNEVPTILKRGEEVLTEDDPRHRKNLSGFNLTQVNDLRGASDPALMMQMLDAAGRRLKAEIHEELERRTRG